MTESSNHNTDIVIAFGVRLRTLRKARGFSQEAFADAAGLDRSYVGGVERGARNISLINIKKLSDALGITIKDIFDDDFKL